MCVYAYVQVMIPMTPIIAVAPHLTITTPIVARDPTLTPMILIVERDPTLTLMIPTVARDQGLIPTTLITAEAPN